MLKCILAPSVTAATACLRFLLYYLRRLIDAVSLYKERHKSSEPFKHHRRRGRRRLRRTRRHNRNLRPELGRAVAVACHLRHLCPVNSSFPDPCPNESNTASQRFQAASRQHSFGRKRRTGSASHAPPASANR